MTHTSWRFRRNSDLRYSNSHKTQVFIQTLKTYRIPLLLIAFAIASLLLFFHFTKGESDTVVSKSLVPQHKVVSETYSGLPVRLVIPAINVNAAIEHVGVDSRGNMEVPSNVVDVGWFKLGSRPGVKGSAVISGHFNGENGEEGVFNKLDRLKKGHKLHIKDDKGAMITFIVQKSRVYNPGYAEEVFSTNDNTYLNLITCDGVWDKDKKSYSKRLVIFASIEK